MALENDEIESLLPLAYSRGYKKIYADYLGIKNIQLQEVDSANIKPKHLNRRDSFHTNKYDKALVAILGLTGCFVAFLISISYDKLIEYLVR